MKKQIWLAAIVAIMAFSACNTGEQEKQEKQTKEETQALRVTQVMQNPEKYLDKEIKVEGMVSHICQHGGKRLHLSEGDSEEKLRVRAGKKIGQFQKELEGNNMLISGKFVEERIDQEYINKLRKGEVDKESHDHHAGEDHEEEKETEESEESHTQGVSEDFIKEMQAKIDSTEEGYISEYWLESNKIEKK
ncbi:MAG: hypothetical protein ACLFNL_06685 [Bacteroidales bacterium]